MTTDGRQLEALVAFVEKTLLPAGFTVTTNDRILNDDGVQIAEFDIQARGKVGSTDFTWLIECRDRPSQGPAPASWIEQLVGRRARFGFNKVSAVSTTGFAVGAQDYAVKAGIELREVKALEPEAFSDWLFIRFIDQIVRRTQLESCTVLLDDSEPKERQQALTECLAAIDGNAAFLRSEVTGSMVTAALAFKGAIDTIEGIFDNVIANGPGKGVELHVLNPEDDAVLVDTREGAIRPRALLLKGIIRVEHVKIPLATTTQYERAENGEVISQLAAFAPQSLLGTKFSVELHKMAETGETHVALRRITDAT